MKTLRTLLLLLIVVGLLVPSVGIAQDTTKPPATPAVPPAEEAQPTVVPIAELSSQLAAAQLRLRDIEEAAGEQPGSEAALAEVEAFAQSLQERQKQFDSRPIETYSLTNLEQTKAKWKLMGEDAARWEKMIARRLVELDGYHMEIEVIRTSWRETSEGPQSADFPPEIVSQIAQLLNEVETTDSAVSERTEWVLSKQKYVTGFRVSINETIKQMEVAAAAKRGDLFTLDSPPIWAVLGGDTAGVSTITKPDGAIHRIGFVESMRLFLLQYPGQVVLHIFLTVFFALFIWRMRRSALTWEGEDELLQTALRLFRHPLAAAILVLWISPGDLYAHAPFVVFEMMGVAVLGAAFVLVPSLVPRRVVRPVYAVFIIGVLEHLNSVIATNAVSHRVNTVGITALMLALVVWWNLRGETHANVPSGWRKYTWMLRPFAWLLAGALAALVIGASALGELCSYGLVHSVFSGVVLFIGVRTFESFLVLLLRVHGGRLPRFINQHRKLILRRVAATVRLAALAWWLFASLEEFRLFEPVWNQITQTIVHKWTVGQMSFSIAGVLMFVLVLWVSAMLSRFIRFVLQEDVLPKLPLRRGLPNTILLMVNYGIMTLGIVIALASLGLETSQFTVIVGALGVGVGFGLQGLVNNFVSGLILMFERPVQIDDTVEVGTLTGSVKRIGIRASIVRTFSGAEVIVPNGDLVSGQVINWTLSDRNRRLELHVGVKYGSDPQKVVEVLMKSIEGNTRLMEDPEPYVMFKGFGESSLDFELRAWTSDPLWWILGGEIKMQMYAALKEAGIEIPYPQRDLHLRTITPDAADVLKKGRTDD